MNHQHAPIQRQDDELTMPLHGLDQLIANTLAQRRKILANHVMREELRVHDAASSELRLRRANEGINFRQLRHGSLQLRTSGSIKISSPSDFTEKQSSLMAGSKSFSPVRQS